LFIKEIHSNSNPFETTQVGITPNGADLVSLVEYDTYGHETNKWLPASIGGSFGCKIDPNLVKSGAISLNKDQRPYNTTEYERSSLNRVVTQWGAGKNWVDVATGEGKITMDYQTNGNDVFWYKISGSSLVKSSTNYPSGSLYVTRTKQEDNHVVYEYKDKLNRVILNRAVAEAGNHDTYYVYDNFGMLRFVLSPEASSIMTEAKTYLEANTYLPAAPNTSSNSLDQLAYIYLYDGKHRCIKKKLPGADWIYMVYDVADRLILSQDGNQRSNGKSEWTFIKYDKLGRVAQSGISTITTSHSVLQSTYANVLFIESYNKATHSYTSTPGLLSNSTILIQNFYDVYDFPATFSGEISTFKPVTGGLASFDAKYDYYVNNENLSGKGLLTGTEVSMIDNPSQKNCTVFYYNDKGQPVQTLSSNHLGGYDNDFFAYNFIGQPVRKRHTHSAYLSDPTKTVGPISEDLIFSYDHAGRLTDTYHSIIKNNVTISTINLCSLQYDELGRVFKKTLHGGLQSILQTYNVRSWIKSINSPVFSETLFYQDAPTGATALYNGNISAMQWGNNGLQDKQYLFTYDQLNRLKKAKYSPGESYNEEVGSYDRNGNINTLIRKGYVHQTTMDPVVGNIDNLTLGYYGNQLVSVRDAVNSAYNLTTNDFKDHTTSAYVSYKYDANGNLIADYNKGIAWIKYNSLNLPSKIQFINGNKSEYLYDASGVKRESKYSYAVNTMQIPWGQTSTENTGNNLCLKSKTDYCGSYIYENDTIKRILTSEGYIQTEGANPANTISNWKYTYFLKDHLGNTRAQLISASLGGPRSTAYTVAGLTDYYPFGMEISTPEGLLTSGKNPYLYNGKEMDRMNGLDMYDYGARWYDAALGKWHCVDPLHDRHYDWSPYVYVLNNPICKIDLYGLTYWDAVWQGIAGFTGGLASTTGGVAAAMTPTGVGQLGGAALISLGVPAMGLGIAKIVTGFKDNGSAENVPLGLGETLGMGVDKVAGNENGEFRKIGAVTDIVTNLAVGGIPKTSVEVLATGSQIIGTASDILNTDSGTGNQTTGNATTASRSQVTNSEITKAVVDNTTVVNAPVKNMDSVDLEAAKKAFNEQFGN